MTESAATFNTALLREYQFDIHKLITSTTTICTPGIEFKSPHLLDKLLHQHSLWPFAKRVLTEGADLIFLNDIDDESRQQENEALITFNNHNKAKLHSNIIHDSIATDVSYGFTAPILIDAIKDIPGAMVCPLGIAQQTTLSPEGLRIPKNRLTHDQTFSVLDTSLSVNKNLDIKAYPDLIYGFCLRRIIYQILSLRFHHPTQPILIAKYDIKQAFRRIHYSGLASTKCIAVFNNLAYLQLRMTFGGSNCPTTWCSVSELIADLANDILDSSDWTPDNLHWEYQHLVPQKSVDNTNTPFAQCLNTLLLPPPKPQGSVDIYIDDAITTCLDASDFSKRSAAAVPLAIDVLSRPYCDSDVPQREHMLALSKLRAEGALQEHQIILGWRVDTRRLLIQIPNDKYLAWIGDIDRFLHNKKVKHHEMESLVGRLNNVGYIIPLGRFFLGDLRKHIHRSKNKWSRITLQHKEIAVLRLWKKLLRKANNGINMNLLTIRQPTNITVTDACLSGMGGFSVTSGRAWRIYFPRPITHLHINSVEFLASVVGVWLEVYYKALPTLGSLLALTDNASCVCWLKRSSFNSATRITDHAIACQVASIIIASNSQLNSQHVPGAKNKLADSLSRDVAMSDTNLTANAISNFPSQVPKHFRIYPIPRKIICWIYSILQLENPSFTEGPNPETKSRTCHGTDGQPSLPPANSTTTPTSTISATPNDHTSQTASSNPSATDDKDQERDPPQDFSDQVRDRFSAGLSAIPSVTWRRNFGVLRGSAPFTNIHNKISSTTLHPTSFEPGPTQTLPSTATVP
jgi:hypothetical protein